MEQTLGLEWQLVWAVCRSKHGVCPDVGVTLVSNGTHG